MHLFLSRSQLVFASECWMKAQILDRHNLSGLIETHFFNGIVIIHALWVRRRTVLMASPRLYLRVHSWIPGQFHNPHRGWATTFCPVFFFKLGNSCQVCYLWAKGWGNEALRLLIWSDHVYSYENDIEVSTFPIPKDVTWLAMSISFLSQTQSTPDFLQHETVIEMSGSYWKSGMWHHREKNVTRECKDPLFGFQRVLFLVASSKMRTMQLRV